MAITKIVTTLVVIFIEILVITFFQEFIFKLFISLECKYNMLQFGIRISSIETSKQKLHISTALNQCLQQNLQQRNPSSSDYFLKNKEIPSVFQ